MFQTSMALGKTDAETSLPLIDLPNMSMGSMSNGAHSHRVWMVGAGDRYPVMSAISGGTDLAKHRISRTEALTEADTLRTTRISAYVRERKRA
jgi:hypothetical protein